MAADLTGLDLSSEEVLTINLFDDNKGSVVNITNVGLRRNSMSMAVEQVPRGTGSGFIWDDKGHIVTNFHVIQVSEYSLDNHRSPIYVPALIYSA